MKQKKETTPEEMQDFMKGFLKSSGTHPMSSKDQMEALFEEAMQDESDEQFILPANLPAGTPAQQQDRLPAEQLDGLHDSQPAEVLEAPVVSRRISSKQRKASLEEYRDVFFRYHPSKTANRYSSVISSVTDLTVLSVCSGTVG